MFSYFMRFCVLFWHEMYGLVIAAVIVNKILFALYMKANWYDKWWLGFVPLGHLWCKREIAGVPIATLVLQGIFLLLFMYTFNLTNFVLWVVLSCVNNFLCSRIIVGTGLGALYSFCPIAKYVIQLKEVIASWRS